MRKIIIVVAALVILAVSAQPAAADDPGAQHWSDYGTNRQLVGCNTPLRTGALGQYGAQGFFIDGCTAKAWCPDYATQCKVTGSGFIGTYESRGHRVTLNSRVQRFFRDGTVIGWQDTSCAGTNVCYSPDIVTMLRPGQSASEQCNGVRQNAPNTASVRCSLWVEYLY